MSQKSIADLLRKSSFGGDAVTYLRDRTAPEAGFQAVDRSMHLRQVSSTAARTGTDDVTGSVAQEAHDDDELIQAVRGGTVAAFALLYERHVGAAHKLARQLTRSQVEAEDLVAEAFARVLNTIRAGRGPDHGFLGYLLTALRHTAYDKTRRERKVELAGDLTLPDHPYVTAHVPDTATARPESSHAARAFARLPARWRAVLWQTEVEGRSPAEVASALGMTPTGVSALAYRAREGLRQAYLQVHLADVTAEQCRATTARLAAWVRGGLSRRQAAQVEDHLDGCATCRGLAEELADVNGGLR